jgi:hypothetical protein
LFSLWSYGLWRRVSFSYLLWAILWRFHVCLDIENESFWYEVL